MPAKLGIGLEFFKNPVYMNIGGGYFPQTTSVDTGVGIYLPVKPMKESGVMFEPFIGHNSYKEITDDFNDDYYGSDLQEQEIKSSTWVAHMGIFFFRSSEKATAYAGMRIGKAWIISESSQTTSGQEETVKEEEDMFIFSPAIGVEYNINQNISLGGEVLYTTLKQEELEDNYTETTTIRAITPKFIMRFYF
tara:strand:- start:506 stop:1081 length:576 start_codon:yes stop_codon:yes gene_type:complete